MTQNKKTLVALVLLSAAAAGACRTAERREPLRPHREISLIGTGTAAVMSYGRFAPDPGAAAVPPGIARLGAVLGGTYISPVTSANDALLLNLCESPATNNARVAIGYWRESAGRAVEGYDGFAVGLTRDGSEPLMEISLPDFVAVARIASDQIPKLMVTRAPTISELREYASRLEQPMNPFPVTLPVSAEGVAALNSWHSVSDAQGRRIEIPRPTDTLHVRAYTKR